MGYKRLKGVELENGDQLDLGGLFVEIGSTPNIKLAEMVGVKVEKGYIVVDKHQRTSVEGVFAAGDVTNNPLKQIVTACGEGAIAAKTAYDEISS
jgi:thioredoxin reductase (NADPH)